MNRRQALISLLSALGLLASGEALAGRRGAKKRRKTRRRVRRKVRRRVRRRHRRRVRRRVIKGRSLLVVPVAVAVGWELMVDDRVVVVHQIKTVERDAAQVEVVVIKNADGSTEELEIAREDNDENSAVQQGSVLAEGDSTTPGTEAEEEVEIEIEVDE
jgi:hypothetical protein